MATLFLHFGLPKTGTTSLETFCATNREALLNESNLYFPETEHWDTQHSSLLKNITREAWEGLKNTSACQQPDRNILLTCEVTAYTFDEITQEHFAIIKETFPNHTIKIILYIHRVDELCKSLYKQLVKTNYKPRAMDYASFCADGLRRRATYFFPSKIIEKAYQLIGRENPILRIYDKKTLKNRSIVDDFFDAIKIALPKTITSTELRNNPSIPHRILPFFSSEFLDFQGSTPLYKEFLTKASQAYRIQPGTDVGVEHLEVCQEEINKISEYLPEYKALFTEKPLSFSHPDVDVENPSELFLASLLYATLHRLDIALTRLDKLECLIGDSKYRNAHETNSSNLGTKIKLATECAVESRKKDEPLDDNTSRFIDFFGVKLLLSPAMSDLIRERIKSGKYEAQEINTVLDTVTSDDVVLELGASLGAMSTVVVSKVKPKEYWCVEANPEMVSVMEMNHKANDILDCKILSGVLSHNAEKSFVDFYIATDCWASSLKKTANYSRIEQVPLLDCVKTFNRIQPTYLICDIEHGEYDLLNSSLDLSSVKKICLEIHGGLERLADKRKLLNYLTDQNFLLCSPIQLSRTSVVYLEKKGTILQALESNIDHVLSSCRHQGLSVLDLRNKESSAFEKLSESSYDLIIVDLALSFDQIAQESLKETPLWSHLPNVAKAVTPNGFLCISPSFKHESPFSIANAPDFLLSIARHCGLDVPATNAVAKKAISAPVFLQRPGLERSNNIAVGSVVTQSSLSKWSYSPDEAMYLVSGVRLATHVMHTSKEISPWVTIDLGNIHKISSIKIFNRPQHSNCADLLEIFASNDNANYTLLYSHRGKPTFGGQYNGKPLCVACSPPLEARYIKVQIAGVNFLHLDQIEIYEEFSECIPNQRRVSIEQNNSAPKNRPDFLCIGAQKAGTSWLFQNLSSNRQIWMPPIKELHFFDYMFCSDTQKWGKWHLTKAASLLLARIESSGFPVSEDYLAYIKNLSSSKDVFTEEWYKYVFSYNKDCSRIYGDITPEYSCLPGEGIKYLKTLLGSPKIIYIIREPFARLVSQIKMNASRANMPLNAGENDWKNLLDKTDLKSRGDYKTYVPRWNSFFPHDSILYMPFGLIAKDSGKFLRTVENFLGVDSIPESDIFRGKVWKSKDYAIPEKILDCLREQTDEQYTFLESNFSREFISLI